MQTRLALSRTLSFLALAAIAAEASPARAQGAAPAPYPPPASYAPSPGAYPPGTYAPAPGGYPAGTYAPPGPYPAYPAPHVEEPPPPALPAAATHLGAGYKIGNGLGFVGGDIIVSPLPHVAIDLQLSRLSADMASGTATGFGLAPALHFDIRPPGVSTPYVGVGYVYAKLYLSGVTGWASGLFINAGYEWKWSFGMGILVGGGVCYVGEIKATDGVDTIDQGAKVFPNLEAGVRFMFF
ncbi:MAG: hypothetical protein JXP73_02200 [Deltaproteobacteria bacterium]|nr:hypothetical protein [Deltaproteobacteria bacterium]